MLTLDGQVVGIALVALAVWLVFSVRALGARMGHLETRMDRFEVRLQGLDDRLRGVEVAVARLAAGRGGASS